MDWINRSSYRSAVFEAIARPRSGKQILEFCQSRCPKISFQDIRHVLRDLADRRVARCLNPEVQTGRLYVRTGNQFEEVSLPAGENLELIGMLARGRTRLAVLIEVAKPEYGKSVPKTASVIRRRMLEDYPMSLSWMITTLHQLCKNGLIEVADRTRKRQLLVYRSTALGRCVLRNMGTVSNCESLGISVHRRGRELDTVKGRG